jgi:hypothetical protein
LAVGPPGLVSMAIFAVSFLSQLAADKLVARDDTERSGVGTTPLKPKEGLNGPPQIFLQVGAAGVIFSLYLPQQVELLGVRKGNGASNAIDTG